MGCWWILLAGTTLAADGLPTTPSPKNASPARQVRQGGCSPHEPRQLDAVIAHANRCLDRLTEVYKAYRGICPGAVGILDLTFTVVPGGSVSTVGVTSGTLLDSAFLAAVKAAVRAWQFCAVDDTLGDHEIPVQMSFADKEGMVRALLHASDDPVVQENSRVFEDWCGGDVRATYAHWLAFKGPVTGSLKFACDCRDGRIAAVTVVGGSLADHPMVATVLPHRSQLLGKRLDGLPDLGTVRFAVDFVDLRAPVMVFDGKMEYHENRGWYYTHPYWVNNPAMTPRWRPPAIRVGF